MLLAVACCGIKAETVGKTAGPTAPAPTAADPGSVAVPVAPQTPEEKFRADFVNPGGMWMPSQMTLPKHVEIFNKMGVSIPAERLADPLASPLGAIVFLGGCSASFVSPDGLVVTNHHCVQRALQHNSSDKQNLVEHGFLAQTRADELGAGPTRRIWVAQSFRDVTSEMRDGLEKIRNPKKRKQAYEDRSKRLIAACEKGRPGIRCSLKSFFNGDLYKLIAYLEIRDVRLVYVPRRSIGNYGGEQDNWAWPRHTGDFAFYRAYVAPDGKPAEYAPENVPYTPTHYLKVSTAGVHPGDFVMVAGYPGRTERCATAAAIEHDVAWTYPHIIDYLKQRYAITETLISNPNKTTAIKAGVAKQMTQNYLEKSQGVFAGLTQGDLLERKRSLDDQIKAWAQAPGPEAVKAAIEKLAELEAEQHRTAEVDFERNLAFFRSSRLFATALELVRMASERPKKDTDRKPGYQNRDMPNLIAKQKAFNGLYDRQLDKALFKFALTRAAGLPAADRPWLGKMLGVKKGARIDAATIDAALKKMYEKTGLEDEGLRVELMQKGTMARLRTMAAKDPVIKAALAVWPMVKVEESKSDAREGELLLVQPAYARGMREVLGGFLSPDANATLRITYGTVRSFNPASTAEVDRSFTTASQIPAKNTGNKPFDAPQELLEAIQARTYGPYADAALDGALPVNFLSDLDITGGNSGSAVLNSKGELVGLAFDGTIAGVASDVVFNSETQRTISVDIRYVLWIMDVIDNADHLLKEMGITPAL